MNIGRNIAEIRKMVDAAAAAGGRRGGDVTIVAATKYAGVDIINSLSEYNIRIAGENRVQDFLEKYPDVNTLTEWHFIGRLQTNKVKYIIDKVRLIHSADRLPLIEEIERQCALKNIGRMDVLIEVNIGGEEQKGGISPGKVFEFYESIKAYPRVRVRGLMTVMPVAAGFEADGGTGAGASRSASNGEKCRNLYLQMKLLYDILKSKDKDIDILSMGMSDDFEAAVRCGSTMIRLGRALFN